MHEPGIAELLERNAERLTFTTAMDDVLDAARLLFCCVDTPPDLFGRRGPLARQRRGRAARRRRRPRAGDEVHRAGRHRRRDPAATSPSLAYVSCPEFLKEGSAVQDFLHPDRVVIGADAGDEWAADAVEHLYAPLGGEIVRTDVASAEMIKLASNAFLATKISFINEIANVCEEVGADVTEVARGMGLDNRIGPAFLQAGIGFGGCCFPKDATALKQLAGNSGYHFQLLNSVIEVNELQKRRVIKKLEKHLGSLVGKRIALLGPRLQARHRRHARGVQPGARRRGFRARARRCAAYDPVAEEPRRAMLPDVEMRRLGRGRRSRAPTPRPRHRVARVRRARLGELRATDGDPAADRRAQLPRPGELRAAGFTYEGIGRPARERREADAGARPRRGRGNPAPPADPYAARSRRCRWWIGRSSASWSTGSPATASRGRHGLRLPGRGAARGARRRRRRAGRAIRYVEEPEPLGTAGPIRLAADEGLSTTASWC